MSEENGWGEYSKLVLKELESLAANIQILQNQIVDLKSQIVELKAERSKVADVLEWKARIDEISSPSQLLQLKNDVESLKMFKTKAVTIFLVVQFAMGIAISLSKFL